MKLQDITFNLRSGEKFTITQSNNLRGGEKFTITQSDWEGAGDPICMALVTPNEWEVVAREVGDAIKDMEDSGYTFAEMEDEVWSTYESAVVKYTTSFYYEDLTDEEYNFLQSLALDSEEYIAFCKKCYARINEKQL